MATSPASALEALFNAHRALADAQQTVLDVGQDDLVRALKAELEKTAKVEDEEEASRRYIALTEILAELEGPAVVEMLIDVLDLDDADARQVAGESLVGLASDRFKEVAQVVEKQLATRSGDSGALRELPYVFAMIPEGSSVKLLEKFLAHKEAEVVASAIEALVEIGDPAGARALEALKKDKREVSVEDDGEDAQSVTIGELAQEALTLLRGAGRN
jgi:HEAT repeat protein